jgi:inosose dehydratase
MSAPADQKRPQIANAPCSWGALEWSLPGQGAAYATVLDEIKDTGYVGTELGDWGFMPTAPDKLRDALAARSLQLVGAFVPVAFVSEEAVADGCDRAVKTARLMFEAVGPGPFIVLADDNGKVPARTKMAGRINRDQGLTAVQWAGYGDRVNRVAAAVKKETGLRSVFHHHCAGYVETPWEIESLLEATDPGLVGLCFDTGHYRFGGGLEPVDLLRRHRQRIWHVHFKDCSASVHDQSRKQEWDYFEALKNAVFCELGRGDVPFPAVIKELEQSQYTGWIVVEQDVLPGMGAPKKYARANREYLAKFGL